MYSPMFPSQRQDCGSELLHWASYMGAWDLRSSCCVICPSPCLYFAYLTAVEDGTTVPISYIPRLILQEMPKKGVSLGDTEAENGIGSPEQTGLAWQVSISDTIESPATGFVLQTA